jgi:hypothetical protein
MVERGGVRSWWFAALMYVLGSSVLGLAFVVASAGLDGFFGVWGANFLADLVFIGGTVGAGWASVWVARRRVALALLFAFILNWAVYGLSARLLGGESSGDFDFGVAQNVFPFVLRFGFPGLVFATVAPAIWTHWRFNDAEPRAPAPFSPVVGSVPTVPSKTRRAVQAPSRRRGPAR